MQVIDEEKVASMVLVAKSDIESHAPWRMVLETAADTVLTCHALSTGRAAEVNMQVHEFVPNRWGMAVDAAPVGAASLCTDRMMYANASERGTTFRFSN